jgi:hypothetical protein
MNPHPREFIRQWCDFSSDDQDDTIRCELRR